MCGIFGVVAPQPESAESFDSLARANTVRGNRAFGVMSWSSQHCAVVRRLGPWESGHFPMGQVVLGHVRAPTNGSDALQATHPFETPEFLLAHNGILLTPEVVEPALAYSGVAVDSMALVHGVDRELRAGAPVAQAIAATASALDGQQACWLWHKREEALYLWRVMSTLFWGGDEKSRFVFSSAAVEGVNTALTQGRVVRVTVGQPAPVVVAEFKFYSPYLIVEEG